MTASSFPILALLTDFGTRDPFVGVMKGVILARCPSARIVDLTHSIEPQNIEEAAFWLERSVRWFPAGTVFVAVVDPGVGSARRGIAMSAGGYRFVGPDNGLLTAFAAPRAVSHAIDVGRLGLPVPSATFHGRDVFAPVAAEIASGRLRVEDVGDRVTDLALLERTAPVEQDGVVTGAVVTIDRFGNLISNIDGESLPQMLDPTVSIDERSFPVFRTYSDVATGQPLALVNSFGTVEVAIRDGNAARTLNVARGASVRVHSARRRNA